MLDNFAGLMIAMCSGFFGASFFMLAQLQSRLSEGSLDDVREMWGWGIISLRCLVGVGGALILYFFFQSGMLQGSIWPKLTELNFAPCCTPEKLWVPNKDLSLLIVWSFLAGYSQTLVPSILVKTEARAKEDNG